MFNVGDIWNFDFMWDAFAYFLKLVAPFLMLAVAVLATGGLLYMVVIAVAAAVKKN